MTLQDYLILEGIDVPDTAYGYWVTNDGTIVPVEDQAGHLRALAQLLHNTSYNAAFQHGFVRMAVEKSKKVGNTVVNGALDVELHPDFTTVATLYSTMKVITHNYINGMYINIDFVTDNTDVIATHTFDNDKKAMLLLKSLIMKAKDRDFNNGERDKSEFI